jgi:glycosyltransferase involved in cell wall biosynthesis
MRVLHLYSGNLYGGVETLLVALARHRDQAPGMAPAFGLSYQGRLSQELVAEGVEVHALGEVRLRRPDQIARARAALRALLEREAFDTVVCHSAWPQVVFGPAVRRSGLPLVLWVHSPPDRGHWLQWLASRVPPDLAICNSRFTAAAYAAVSDVPTRVVYFPWEPTLASPTGREAVREELGTARDDVVIVQLSRMEEWKGHRLHLEALGRLQRLQGWSCWMAGGAQRPGEEVYLEGLRRQARQLGIAERVRFIGQRNDVPRLLEAADIHCQPNLGPEPFGIAFVEALGAGLPSVTTAMGGAMEIVDDDCGALVEPGDSQGLASALETLVRDPELRADKGRRGRQRMRELFAPDVQMRELDRFLGETVSHATRA